MRIRFVLGPQFAIPSPLWTNADNSNRAFIPLNLRRQFATAVVCLLAFIFILAIPATAIEPKLSVPIMPLKR